MSEDNVNLNAEQSEQGDERIPINGAAVISFNDTRMEAYLSITEERDGGDPVTLRDITDEIEANGVVHEVTLDEAKMLLEEKRYGKKVLISKGKRPVNGRDGRIDYLFETTNELVPKKGKLGEVDYKDLGLVRNIIVGELIAVIHHPDDGASGVNVLGQEILPVAGKPIKYIVGQGTVINEEETEIKAAVSGNLVWQKGGFAISETLVIPENVDVSTGNIDFIGDVLVKGNVAENFTVKSKKNVTINGTVTGATVIAEGSVFLNLGSVNSDIVAKGDVKLGFCESSKIECSGNFSSQSIIGGEVFCGGTINLTQGRGVVYGGKHVAIGGFIANIIGTESYTKTQITLGNSAVLAEEKLELTTKIKDLEERTKKLLQVAEVLQEQKKNSGPLPADREAMLTTAIRSRFTFQREVKILSGRIAEIEKELDNAGDQYIIVHKNLWPGVTVRIGSELMIVDRHLTKVMIGKDEEGHLAYLPFTPKPSKTSSE
ncbi:MAG: FapA family protein [Oscillospiraceae bacterium]|nr:FapA family protein [Oscillospiraceae bacterium]